MTVIENWHGTLLVDGEPLVFEASPSRPPRMTSRTSWECFGDAGLMSDILLSRGSKFHGWAMLHPLLGAAP